MLCNSVNDRNPKLHITNGWLLWHVNYISLKLLKHRLNMKMKVKACLGFSNPVAETAGEHLPFVICGVPFLPLRENITMSTSYLEHFPAFKRSYPNIWRLLEVADGAPSAGLLANSTNICLDKGSWALSTTMGPDWALSPGRCDNQAQSYHCIPCLKSKHSSATICISSPFCGIPDTWI